MLVLLVFRSEFEIKCKKVKNLFRAKDYEDVLKVTLISYFVKIFINSVNTDASNY